MINRICFLKYATPGFNCTCTSKTVYLIECLRADVRVPSRGFPFPPPAAPDLVRLLNLRAASVASVPLDAPDEFEALAPKLEETGKISSLPL